MTPTTAGASHKPGPTWKPEETEIWKKARKIAKAKERERAAAADRQTRAAAPDGWAAREATAARESSSSLPSLLLSGLRPVWRFGCRLLCKAMFVMLKLVAPVACVGALAAWLWTQAGSVPGVQPALNILFTALMLPLGFHQTAPTEDLACVDIPQTDVVLSSHMLDMNRGITFLSLVSGDGDTSGVAAAVVDEALGKNGLIGAAETAGTPKLSTVGKVLLDVSKTVQDMDSRGHGLQEQVEETLTNSYREAQTLLQAMADAKEQPSGVTLWAWTQAAGAALGVPWERARCWLTGQTAAHWMLKKHMGRFQRMLDDAVGAQQQMADAFNDNGGGSVLSELAGLVQAKLCRLDDALAQAVGVGGHALLQAQKKMTEQGSQVRSELELELAQADVALFEAASRELRGAQAIGATLCRQARQTTASLTARRDAVLDLQRALGRIQGRLAKRRAAVEDAVRHDPCLEGDAAAEEEEKLRGMVEDFVKMLETAYVV